MLKFTQQANLDLATILAGLYSFRLNDSIDPALTQEHAERIFDDIADHFATIPMQSYHQRNTFDGLGMYGAFVYTYRRNRTNWYAFYDISNNDYIVTRITNNWNMLLPRL